MHAILKTAAVGAGIVAFAAAAPAQNGPPPGAPPANAPSAQQGQAPPRQALPRRAPQPYKPSPAITASFEGRSANFTGVVDPDKGELCYMLNVAGIDGATAAKVVAGTPDKPGAVTVTLQAPAGGASGTCYTIGAGAAQALLDHPDRYYLEVDNATYPQGAAFAPLRAQTYG